MLRIAYAWTIGDSAVWDITLFDTTNVSDLVTIRLKWKHNGSTVGVDNYEVLNTVRVYPNPSVSILNIEVENNVYSTISLIDGLGKVVLEQQFTNQLDVSSLSKGVYFIQLIGESENPFVQKILIE